MEKRKFLDFLDMIDGGGAGRMGDEFEGGGLLSTLGNLVAKPYGSEDERRRAAREAFYNRKTGMNAPMPTTAGTMAPTAASMATTGASLANMPSPDNFYNNPNQTRAVPDTFYNNPNQVAPAPAELPGTFYNNPSFTAPSPLNPDGNYVAPPPSQGTLPPLDSNGNYVAPPRAAVPNYTPMSSMGMPQAPQLTFQQFVDGLGPVAATASPGALKEAYVQHMSGYAQ